MYALSSSESHGAPVQMHSLAREFAACTKLHGTYIEIKMGIGMKVSVMSCPDAYP